MAPRPALTRLIERPLLSEWNTDELISFAEAAALFFPKGPLSANSLRKAHKEGALAAVHICGRNFTSIGAMKILIKIYNRDWSETNLDKLIAEAEKQMVEKFRESLRDRSKQESRVKTDRSRVSRDYRVRPR